MTSSSASPLFGATARWWCKVRASLKANALFHGGLVPSSRVGRVALLGLIGLYPLVAGAENSLRGRLVTMSALTYDDPDLPLLHEPGTTVMVGDGVEFGLAPGMAPSGIYVVPVTIEILPRRIEISYPPEAGSGQFLQARFNGYVLAFEGECALFTAAKLDAAATSMAVTNQDLSLAGNVLSINVSDRSYGPGLHMAIDLAVTDCALSRLRGAPKPDITRPTLRG